MEGNWIWNPPSTTPTPLRLLSLVRIAVRVPGTNCIGDTHSRDGLYQHWMHAARTVLAEKAETREEWEARAHEIRANVGITD